MDISNIIKPDLNENEFQKASVEVFRFQAENNLVYKEYLHHLNINPYQINDIEQIPFLPISFFKTHKVYSSAHKEDIVFTSSGTTGAESSKHFVENIDIYKLSFNKGFELFNGKPEEYCVTGLLPAYLEREGSSLVYMVEQLIDQSKHPNSGMYLYDTEKLMKVIQENEQNKQKTLLIGVSFALLELAEKYNRKLSYTKIMETGGMKGRRKEIVREELHRILKNAFGVPRIYSEYGMTELLSQAYLNNENYYECPPWMRVLIRDINDPFSLVPDNSPGGINIIDLANINSCSFIQTDDIGRRKPDGAFEVNGRIDYSQIRGCNLMSL